MNMKSLAVIALTLGLAACGGVELPAMPVKDTNALRTLMEGQSAPDISLDEFEQIRKERLASADTLLLGDYIVTSNDGSRSRIYMFCEGDTCEGDWGGIPLKLTIESLINPPLGTKYDIQILMVKNGIVVAQGVASARILWMTSQEQTYAGLLDRGTFQVSSGDVTFNERQLLQTGGVIGEAAQSNPEELDSSIWKGIVTGIHTIDGQFIQGEATVSAHGSNESSIDISFTNIKDLNTGENLEDIRLVNVELLDGSFEGQDEDLIIKGFFMGGDHGEVGGIFETLELTGAFGAALHQ